MPANINKAQSAKFGFQFDNGAALLADSGVPWTVLVGQTIPRGTVYIDTSTNGVYIHITTAGGGTASNWPQVVDSDGRVSLDLIELDDVDDTGLVTDDLLIYDGANFVRVPKDTFVVTAGGSVITGSLDISGHLDVDNLRFDGNAISSQNTNGAINLTPNGSGEAQVAGQRILTESDLANLNDADTLDGLDSTSFVRGDSVDAGAVNIRVGDNDFVVIATTGGHTHVIWYDDSLATLFLGGSLTGVTLRGDLDTEAGRTISVNGSLVLTQADEGTGNGLDADTVDGYHATAYSTFTANAIVTRHSAGYIYSNYFNMVANDIGAVAPSRIAVETSSNGFLRWQTPADFRTTVTAAHYLPIAGKAADSELLDGLDSTSFLRSDAADTGTDITLSSLTVTATNGILWEAGRSRITHNDGGGNCQIRMGHQWATSADRFTAAGSGAVRIRSDIDSVQSALLIDVASNATVAYDDVVTWGTQFLVGHNSLTWGGNQILTTASVASDSNLLDGLDSTSFLRSDAADTATGNITFDGGITMGASQTINHNATSTRDKLRVWTTASYAIGMGTAYTHGWLTNYAMTFQMDPTASRGWWWGTSVDTNAQASMTLSNTGQLCVDDRIAVGGQTTRYLTEPTGDYGSIQVNGSGIGSWEGYNIDGRAVFMHDGASTTGLYNDVNNQWLVRSVHAAGIFLYYNGAIKFETTSAGATVTGDLTVTGGDITLSGTGRIQGIDTVSAATDAANKSYVDTAVAGGGGGLEPWTKKTTTYTAVSGDRILADTTSSAWTLSLPATPAVGEEVSVSPFANTYTTNALTVSGNGKQIEDDTTLVIATDGVGIIVVYDGTKWRLYYSADLAGGGGAGVGAQGGGSDELFYENDQNCTTNYTITSGRNAMTAGPITIDNGVTITVPTGSTWTVV